MCQQAFGIGTDVCGLGEQLEFVQICCGKMLPLESSLVDGRALLPEAQQSPPHRSPWGPASLVPLEKEKVCQN